MIDLPPSPSRLLRATAAFARWLLWLVLAAWLLFSLAWGALHGLIVPRIGELRGQLEIQASRVMGVPVRIGQISAESTGLIPSFELRDVRLLDREGREALRVPRVLATLSPRSALKLGFDQLDVDQLELDVRRSSDGRWWVAGLEVSREADGDGQLADWIFSQSELVLRHARVHWTDALRANERISFNDLNLTLRNGARRHAMQLDFTPPTEWGGRLKATAVMRQPLLSTHSGHWREWEGQVYVQSPNIDLAALRRHADAGFDWPAGSGAIRMWADLNRGEWVGMTTDVALKAVQLRLPEQQLALELKDLSGRLIGRRLAAGIELGTEALMFTTADGLQWPGGNLFLSHSDAEGRLPEQGQLKADRLDLAALHKLAAAMPLDSELQTALKAYQPRGLVERIQLDWQGHLRAPTRLEAKGRLSQLELNAPPPALSRLSSRWPVLGLRGLNLDFDFNLAGGKARVDMRNGSVELPGVFEDPLLRLDQFSSDVNWQLEGERVALQMRGLRFANADVQGEAQLSWHSAEAPAGSGRSRFPGVLDLSGSLSRAEGARVHRYLPLAMAADVRDYVRESVLAGRASGVSFKVKGDLRELPFEDPRQGEFHVSAKVEGATYAYVPRPNREGQGWPALTQLNAELVIDRNTLLVKDARGRFIGAPTAVIQRADAQITSLSHNPVVSVTGDLRGPLTEALAVVARSPLSQTTGPMLARASATGLADYRLQIQVPVTAVERARVQGTVTLAGNDVTLTPDLPLLARARGALNFSESGFSFNGVQARWLGGDVRLDGSGRNGNGPGGDSVISARVQGTASADALRQARELGFVSRLAQYASGNAGYSASLSWRRGVPEISLTSNLQGLALNLPAPLNKPAEQPLPLRLETALARDASGALMTAQDQLMLEVGRVLSLNYLRDISGAEPRVLRGSLAVGLATGEVVPVLEQGVAANINLGVLDLDAWEAVLSKASSGVVSSASVRNAAASAGLTYLPSMVAVRAGELILDGRRLNRVVLGGARDGLTWRANLDAAELNGYVEYRQPVGNGGGRLFARLSRLSVSQGATSEVEALLDEQPASIPALDVVVDDLELRGRKLGRVEVEAINRGAAAVAREGGQREWRLSRFVISTPEASFSATGNWVAIAAQAAQPESRPRAGRAVAERRRTVMNFKLDIADSGELLGRLGMKDVIRRGKGRMEGQVSWVGSPLAPDYPSMSGQFAVNVETGQFLKADPGLAKLLGVLSLQSLPRRLTLDFRDVFSEGFAFDFVRGDVVIEQGMASTNNLQMKGVNAAVLMDGKADIARETQDIKVVVVPEINAGTASLVAAAINPAVGLGTVLAQLFLRRPLIQANTQEFHVTGGWADPQIVKVEHTPPADGKPESTP